MHCTDHHEVLERHLVVGKGHATAQAMPQIQHSAEGTGANKQPYL